MIVIIIIINIMTIIIIIIIWKKSRMETETIIIDIRQISENREVVPNFARKQILLLFQIEFPLI